MCEIVILESQKSRRYNKTTFRESPPPQITMTLKFVPVRKEDEKNAGGLPTVKVPVVQRPATVKVPVVNPVPVKSSVVRRPPIQLPVVSLPATKSPAVQTSPPSTDGGQAPAKNGNNKGKGPANKPKHSSVSGPSHPEPIRRVSVKPGPTKVRVPKVVRFDFDETRNTAMEVIVAKTEDKKPYAHRLTSSSDSSDDSFTDSPSPTSTPTFHSYHHRKTPGPNFVETQPSRKSVRFSPYTKDNKSSRSMDRNTYQAGDNMSRKPSGKMATAGALGSANQTENPNSKTFRPSKVATDDTSPAHHRNGSTASSGPKYLPESERNLEWTMDSDLESNIDPGDCVWDSDDDDAWSLEHYGSPRPGKALEPIFVIRTSKNAPSSPPKPAASSSGKPLEPILVYQPKSKDSSAAPPTPKKQLEPVFILRDASTANLKEPVFIWRPSSDINKETKCLYENKPAGLDFVAQRTTTAKSVTFAPHFQHFSATDQPNTNVNTGPARDYAKKSHRRRSTTPHRSPLNRPAIIIEEDEEEETPAPGVSWRDV